MIRRFLIIAALLAPPLAAGVAGPATAGPGVHGFGPRVGVGFGPNQFVVGGHADFGDLFPQARWILPLVEVGLGDGETWITVATDLVFHPDTNHGGWTPYVGGELAFQFTSREGDDLTELGLLGVLGADRSAGETNRFGLELKFGIIDSPNARLMAVWTFAN